MAIFCSALLLGWAHKLHLLTDLINSQLNLALTLTMNGQTIKMVFKNDIKIKYKI